VDCHEEFEAFWAAQVAVDAEKEAAHIKAELVAKADPLTRGQEARRKGQAAKQRILKGDW
jgi:hypothetical protein